MATNEQELPPGTDNERVLSDYCVAMCDGRCCRRIGLRIRPQGMMKELIKTHYGTQIDEVRITLHHRCPHLTDDGLCDLWNEDPELDERPDFCKNFLCVKARNRWLEVDAGGDGDVEIVLE